MIERIKYFEVELSQEQLVQELRGEARVKELDLNYDVDFSEVDKEFNRYLYNTKIKQKDLDKFLVEPLHKALNHIPINKLLDMRVWHWLCVKRFPNVILARWVNEKV